MPDKNPLELDYEDKETLKAINALDDDKRLELLRLLHGERTLEYQIYAAREQWLWVPITTCFAGAILAISTSKPIISIGLCLVTGLTAAWVARRRRKGLLSSYDALTMRHKWVVALTDSAHATPRMKPLSFDDRITKQKQEGSQDAVHSDSFRYPLDALPRVVVVWIGLLAVAVASSVKWPIRWPFNWP